MAEGSINESLSPRFLIFVVLWEMRAVEVHVNSRPWKGTPVISNSQPVLVRLPMFFITVV